MLTYELSPEQAAALTSGDMATVSKEHQLTVALSYDVQVAYRVLEVATEAQMGAHDNALVGEVVASSSPLVPNGWFTLLRWRGEYATLLFSGTRPVLGGGSTQQDSTPKEEPKPKTEEGASPNSKKRRRGNQNTAPKSDGAIPL